MINANNSIITVISTLVSQMTPLVTIDANVVDGDNWRLDMCATFWLNVGTVVTIGGESFTVVSYVKNTSITVSGTAQPIGTTFLLTAPEFAHGSHRKVEGERKAPTDLSLPFVYLPVPEVTESNEPNDDLAYTGTIRPIFLLEYDPDRDEIDLQQDEIIEPCHAMVDFFLWLIEDQTENFERPEGITRIPWMNFGDKTTWGNDKTIFDQKLSGVETRFDLEVNYAAPCLCEGVDPVICAPVTMTWNAAPITSSDSGGNKDILTVDAADGVTPVGSKTTDTGTELIIEISVGGDPAGNEVNGDAKTDIVGGTTKNFVIKYANGNPVVVTEDSDNAILFEGNVPNPLSLVSTSPSTSGQQTSYSGVGELDEGARFIAGDFASVVYADITDDFTLLLDNEWGHKQRLTGDTGGYMDFATGLFYDASNVATTKALAFPNDILRDYAFRRRWYLNRSGSRTWAASMTAIGGETKGGESGWMLPTRNEYDMLANNNSSVNSSLTYIDSRLFNWSAFNMWTSTTLKSATGNAYRYNSGGNINSSAVKTQANGNAYVKLF